MNSIIICFIPPARGPQGQVMIVWIWYDCKAPGSLAFQGGKLHVYLVCSLQHHFHSLNLLQLVLLFHVGSLNL